MSREYSCRLGSLIVCITVLLLAGFFPVFAYDVSKTDSSCLSCHATAFKKPRFLSVSQDGTYLGHPWIKPGSHGSKTETFPEGFYAGVLELQRTKVIDNLTCESLNRVIARGREEVPIFERIWQFGDQLCSADSSLEVIQAYLELILKPYLQLYLQPQEELIFSSNSNIHIGKVLFIFGGYDAKIQSRFSFSQMRSTLSGSKGIFKHMIESAGMKRSSISDISLSPLGRLEFFVAREGEPSAGTLNLAGFLMRSPPGSDFQFKSSKIIYLGKHRGLNIDRVNMILTFKLGSFILGANKEPILELDFQLNQARDTSSSFQCSGAGKILLRMDGVVKKLESRTRFSVKFLGLPFVKGLSMDSIELVE